MEACIPFDKCALKISSESVGRNLKSRLQSFDGQQLVLNDIEVKQGIVASDDAQPSPIQCLQEQAEMAYKQAIEILLNLKASAALEKIGHLFLAVIQKYVIKAAERRKEGIIDFP